MAQDSQKTLSDEEFKDEFGGVYSKDGKKFIRWEGDNRIESYKIRDGVEEICDSAFNRIIGIGCGEWGLSIHNIELPDTVKRIGEGAFRAAQLGTIKLQEGIESIGDCAFAWCRCELDIKLPESLISLGVSAFAFTGLQKIRIGKNVKSIGEDCFIYCIWLASIDVDELNENYSSVDGALFDKNQHKLICVPTDMLNKNGQQSEYSLYIN